MVLVNSKSGFTLIETSIVVVVTLILTTIATISLTSLQHKTYLGTTVDTVISDMRRQQLKAIQGDTEGNTTGANYGIYFDEANNRYVLFRCAGCTTYNANDSTNFRISLNNSLTMVSPSTTLPSSTILFTQVSGNVNAFDSSKNTLVIKDKITNDQKTIHINRYGVIYQVD
jgi:prepilin-type N-terminal cleavage/methylation domain-containing protein